MASYDFRSLSDVDFEDLTRDLMEATWGLPLESFAAGRDTGIDLRYARTGDRSVIVQCKHYAGSTWPQLLAAAKAERPKVEALAPGRYVFVTSQPLTPARKQKLLDLFSPFCLGTADIVGRTEVNALLRDHPSVERRHPRLWLTSRAVLDRVLHNGLFERARILADGLPDTLRRYVPHPSLADAQALLDRLHYCVIAGIPGVGKTTLAEVLAAGFVGEGYEFVALSRSISDVLGVLDTSRRQVLYFDDFLGMTALQALDRNEDRDLLSLFGEVQRSSKTRLILTTREYILQQATAAHERLDHPGVDWGKCTVTLDGYDRLHRARILYNHLRYSDLPADYVQALLAAEAHISIVDHDNFSPRIVGWMTKAASARGDGGADSYAARFLDALDVPDALWGHAVDVHVSDASRHLLVVLASLPSDVSLDDLQTAFWAFHQAQSRLHGTPTSDRDAERAIRELDGTFVSTRLQKDRSGPLVRFHNPSIRDVIEAKLRSDAALADALFGAAVFFEQVADPLRKRVPVRLAMRIAAVRTFGADPVRIASPWGGSGLSTPAETATPARRAAIALQTVDWLPHTAPPAEALVWLDAALASVESGDEDMDAVLNLLGNLPDGASLSDDEFETLDLRVLEDIHLMEGLKDWLALYRDRAATHNQVIQAAIAAAFERVAVDEADATLGNTNVGVDGVDSWREEVEELADDLGVRVPTRAADTFDEARRKAKNEEKRAAKKAQSPPPQPLPKAPEPDGLDPIVALFQTLINPGSTGPA